MLLNTILPEDAEVISVAILEDKTEKVKEEKYDDDVNDAEA